MYACDSQSKFHFYAALQEKKKFSPKGRMYIVAISNHVGVRIFDPLLPNVAGLHQEFHSYEVIIKFIQVIFFIYNCKI